MAEPLRSKPGPVVLAKVCNQDQVRAQAAGAALGVPLSPSIA
ncbi:MAG: hypothetical protein WCL49_04025 [bacterium]